MKKLIPIFLLICLAVFGQNAAHRLSGVTAGTTGSSSLIPVITYDAEGHITSITTAAANAGTVTSASIVTANGFSGTVATATTTPAITLIATDIYPKDVYATNNLSFYSDPTTYFSLPSAGQIDITLGGSKYGAFTSVGHLIVGTNIDFGTGAQLQVNAHNSPAIIALKGYGVSGSVYMHLRAGTEAFSTPLTSSQIGRFGSRGNDTAGSETDYLGANLELTPTGTWSGSDHGMTAGFGATPSGTTTRVVNVVDTGAGMSVSTGTATAPGASASLELQGTNKGFLPNKVTTTQKNAISSPAEGLVVYDTTLHKLCVYTGSAWETVTSL